MSAILPGMRRCITGLLVLLMIISSQAAKADTVVVAAGADFAKPMVELKTAFEAKSGHQLEIKSASTAKLVTQLRGGAPFDVLLASDAAAAQELEAEGLGVGDTRFAYALGRLALWSKDKRRIGPEGQAVLTTLRYKTIVIADPGVDPYGVAAQEVLTKMGIWDKVQDKLLIAENSSDAKAKTADGTAEIGLLPRAAIATLEPERQGSAWVVPLYMHAPLRQEAILLKNAPSQKAAREFLDFLKSPEARAVIAGFGYGFQ